MDSTKPKLSSSIQYSRRTAERAELAVRCSPFQLSLFSTMRWQRVELRAIAGKPGVQNHYTRRPISELIVENNLLWLIQVGVLRREVDGQGITDSFRLTPLGHQLTEYWQQRGNLLPSPSLLDRIYNALNRWVRFPTWLQ